jgi:hypothetical protein
VDNPSHKWTLAERRDHAERNECKGPPKASKMALRTTDKLFLNYFPSATDNVSWVRNPFLILEQQTACQLRSTWIAL